MNFNFSEQLKRYPYLSAYYDNLTIIEQHILEFTISITQNPEKEIIKHEERLKKTYTGLTPEDMVSYIKLIGRVGG